VKKQFEHITTDSEILGGKPIIKGTRISVELILEWIANGSSVEEIVQEFPHLKMEAVREAVLFAAALSNNATFIDIELAA
jgi:uncharacterized protein (DUF433 family)